MTSVKRKAQVAKLLNESSSDAGGILPKNQVETHCGVIMSRWLINDQVLGIIL